MAVLGGLSLHTCCHANSTVRILHRVCRRLATMCAAALPASAGWGTSGLYRDVGAVTRSNMCSAWAPHTKKNPSRPAGAMLPFTSREDVDFFVHLEMYLRQEHPPLCGRDHLAFRSAYFPVKDVVDGDLCEQYAQVRRCSIGFFT